MTAWWARGTSAVHNSSPGTGWNTSRGKIQVRYHGWQLAETINITATVARVAFSSGHLIRAKTSAAAMMIPKARYLAR